MLTFRQAHLFMPPLTFAGILHLYRPLHLNVSHLCIIVGAPLMVIEEVLNILYYKVCIILSLPFLTNYQKRKHIYISHVSEKLHKLV